MLQSLLETDKAGGCGLAEGRESAHSSDWLKVRVRWPRGAGRKQKSRPERMLSAALL
jgi:hypothetical protein